MEIVFIGTGAAYYKVESKEFYGSNVTKGNLTKRYILWMQNVN